MPKCIRCGTSVGLFAKLCDKCKREIEIDQVRRISEQQAKKDAELAQAELRRREQLRKMIAEKKAEIRKQLEFGQRVFLYHSLYLPVDSILLEKNLSNVFDILLVRQLGLSGWEVINAVPRTMGVGLKNYTGAALEAWGGGVGGNIMGVHLILKKELTLSAIDNDPKDELGSYIETHIFQNSNI
jgi:hypothetical protein